MAYGEHTKIGVEKTLSDIAALVRKSGAHRIGQFEEPGRVAIQFFKDERMVRFVLTMPEQASEQRRKQRARALLLVIKAKLESVESGIETFEEAFLANVVMSDGTTVGEMALPAIANNYAGGSPQLMLPGGST